MTIFISINKHTIARNRNQGTNDPPFEIRQSKDDPNPLRVHDAILFDGRVRLMYSEKDPLICKAVCWIEIDDEP